MAIGQHEQSRPSKQKPWWYGLLTPIMMVIIVSVGILGVKAIGSLRTTTSASTVTVADSVEIPGVASTNYVLGMAGSFATDTLVKACRAWRQLPDDQKRGLAFVDAKMVPTCAGQSYLKWAGQIHLQMNRQQTRSNFDGGGTYRLGSPVTPFGLSSEIYTCKYIRELTSYQYVSPPKPKTDEFSDNLTQAQRKAWEDYDSWQNQGRWAVAQIYERGGYFPDGCYMPSVVINDKTITFYPRHPVHSIKEAAAPVFAKPGQPTTFAGIGQTYVVKPGDDPSTVALAFYGSEDEWPYFMVADQLAVVTSDGQGGYTLDTSTLHWAVGMTIRIPPAGQ